MRTLSPILLLIALLLHACDKPPAVQRDQALDAAVDALKQGDHEKALTFINEAIALDAQAAHLHQVKGSILFHVGDYSKAVASYDEAYRLNDRNAEACIGAGLALKMMHRNADANARFDRAQNLFIYRLDNPPDPERFSEDHLESAAIHAKLHLALIAALRGETAAALGQIERMETTHPEWEEADTWRAIIEAEAFDQLIIGEL